MAWIASFTGGSWPPGVEGALATAPRVGVEWAVVESRALSELPGSAMTGSFRLAISRQWNLPSKSIVLGFYHRNV